MKRALIAHALFLLIGAVSAWLSWQHVSGHDPRASRLVLNLDPTTIRSVVHDWPGGITTLSFEGSGRARESRLELREKPQELPGYPAPAPDSGAVHFGPPSAVIERGLGVLTPLRARRSWPTPDPALQKRLGFDSQDRWMSLHTDAGRMDIEFGVETYGGDGRYIRLRGESAIYLVDAQLARAFEGPVSRLVDARLVRYEREQILGLRLEVDGRRVEFTQLDRAQPRLRRFVVAGAPEQTSRAIASALDSLHGTFSRAYVSADEVSGQRVFFLQLERDRHEPLEVELIRATDEQLYWLRSGRWQARLNPVAARKLAEEMRGALPGGI